MTVLSTPVNKLHTLFSENFHLDLQWQEPLQTAGVDEWLCGCFGLSSPAVSGIADDIHVLISEPFNGSRVDECSSSTSPQLSLCQWLQRALVLQPVLLQAARIPLFQAAVITAVLPPTSNRPFWRVFLEYRLRHPLTSAMLRESLVNTLRATVWMASHPVTELGHRKTMFQALESQWLSPLRQQQVMGGSTVPLLRTADRLGMPVQDLGHGLYQIGWGHYSVRLHRSVTSGDSAQGGWVAQNKAWTQKMLRMGGFPSTDHWRVSHRDEALRAVQHLGWPVVVKPVDCERGEGVTTQVRSVPALLKAFDLAMGADGRSGQVLVERQVEGFCHRLLVARGRLLYAIERRPPELVGDGRQSLLDLMVQHNERLSWVPPWAMEQPMVLDDEMQGYLNEQGYTPSSIPGVGVAVWLRPFESMVWGGTDRDLTDQVHPENRRLVERVTAFMGLDVAGIDLISPDIRVPWYENGAKINEVNFSPMLGMWPISEKYLREFFTRYCPYGGRIPLRLFCGDESAWTMARRCQGERMRTGAQVYLTRSNMTLCPEGRPWVMLSEEVGERCQALLLNLEVEAMYVVVNQPDELKSLRWIDRWDSIEIVTVTEADRQSWESLLAGFDGPGTI